MENSAINRQAVGVDDAELLLRRRIAFRRRLTTRNTQ
jgi:hypothetical protein